MKKVVLNISDSTYEKLRFEAMIEEKSIPHIIHDRVFIKPFSKEVNMFFEEWMSKQLEKILQD